jgi:hypothetical protein
VEYFKGGYPSLYVDGVVIFSPYVEISSYFQLIVPWTDPTTAIFASGV